MALRGIVEDTATYSRFPAKCAALASEGLGRATKCAHKSLAHPLCRKEARGTGNFVKGFQDFPRFAVWQPRREYAQLLSQG